MIELLEAPEQMARVRSEEPKVYASGDCWRFRWAGEDHGSFDSEQDAKNAALRCKKQTTMHIAAASLNRH